MSGRRHLLSRTDGQEPLRGLHSHIPEKDGERGAAILWVILHNTTTLPMEQVESAFHVLKPFTNPGWRRRVQLFFVLSGFLITGKFLERQNAQTCNRFLRIFPLCFAVLIRLLLFPSPTNTMPDLPRATADDQLSLWLLVDPTPGPEWRHGRQ